MSDEIKQKDFDDYIEEDYSGFEVVDDKTEADTSSEDTETTEETTEDDTEVQTETKTEETTTEVSDETVNLLNSFNEKTGLSYASFDEVKAIMEEYSTLKEKVSQNGGEKLTGGISEQQKAKLKEAYEKLNPKAFFANDTELKKNLLMKSNPNINGEVAGKIFDMDFKSENPLDVIALNMALKHSSIDGGVAGALEVVLEDFGISDKSELEDLSRVQKNKIKIAAEEAASQIASIRDGVSIGEEFDIDSLLSEIGTLQNTAEQYDMTPWNGKIDDVFKMAKNFELKDDNGGVLYTEPIDETFFKEGAKEVVEELIREGKVEPTQENMQIIAEELQKEWLIENYQSVMKRQLKAQERKLKEQFHKEVHNDVDPDKTTSRPKTNLKNTSPDVIRRALGLI